MYNYCVNRKKDNNGKNEVHNVSECNNLPEPFNQQKYFAKSDKDAMEKAKEYFPNSIDGCKFCMPDYHTDTVN